MDRRAVLSVGGIVPLREATSPPQAGLRGARHVADLDEAQDGARPDRRQLRLRGEDVVPDVLTLSKTLGGGLPLAATVTSAAIEEECYEKGFLHFTSHVSDPLPAEVGLAMLRVLAEERLAERARLMGDRLRSALLELQSRHEPIGDVRGRGLMLGVELVKDREGRAPDEELGARVTRRCLELGLNMNIVKFKGLGNVFRLAPPLTVTIERSMRDFPSSTGTTEAKYRQASRRNPRHPALDPVLARRIVRAPHKPSPAFASVEIDLTPELLGLVAERELTHLCAWLNGHSVARDCLRCLAR